MLIRKKPKDRFFATFRFMPAMFILYLPFAILIREQYIRTVNHLVESGKMAVPSLGLWIFGLALVLFFVPLVFAFAVMFLWRILRAVFGRKSRPS